jgi:hypothetical protein
MLGITKYIHIHLQGKTPFSPPPLIRTNKPVKGSKHAAPKVKGKEMGLQIGRYTDILFRKIVDKEVHLNPDNFKHRRCKYLFDVLKANNVLVSKTQVRVKHEALQVRTLLDGLGITKNGNPCVIELKTTQYTLSEHEIRYNQRCRIRPKLANGLPNSEFVLHGLQAAFGALALKETYENCSKPIKALVVVAASDGAKGYWVDSRMATQSMFSGSGITPATPIPRELSSSQSSYNKLKFFSWPVNATRISLEKGLQQRGFTLTKANTSSAYFCSGMAYIETIESPRAIACIGIYHLPINKRVDMAKQTILKRQLRMDATKLYKKYKGKCSIHTFLVSPNASEGGFEFIRATRPMNKKP